LNIPAAIDHFIVRCLCVLGYGIGSAVVDTLLPLAIGIVATGVIGFAAFAVYRRMAGADAAIRSASEIAFPRKEQIAYPAGEMKEARPFVGRASDA